jgi:hypothetical protein
MRSNKAAVLGAWPWLIPIAGISLCRRNQSGIGVTLIVIGIIPCTVIGVFWLLWIGLSLLDGLNLLTGRLSLQMSEITHSIYTLYGMSFSGILWLGIFLFECVVYLRDANRHLRQR